MENVSLKELLIFYKKKIMLLILLFFVILGVSIFTLKILDNEVYETKVTLVSYKEVNESNIDNMNLSYYYENYFDIVKTDLIINKVKEELNINKLSSSNIDYSYNEEKALAYIYVNYKDKKVIKDIADSVSNNYINYINDISQYNNLKLKILENSNELNVKHTFLNKKYIFVSAVCAFILSIFVIIILFLFNRKIYSLDLLMSISNFNVVGFINRKSFIKNINYISENIMLNSEAKVINLMNTTNKNIFKNCKFIDYLKCKNILFINVDCDFSNSEINESNVLNLNNNYYVEVNNALFVNDKYLNTLLKKYDRVIFVSNSILNDSDSLVITNRVSDVILYSKYWKTNYDDLKEINSKLNNKNVFVVVDL